jgi:hypothetical protein
MGWTHYWKRDPEVDLGPFKLASMDCKRIFAVIDVPLSGPESFGEPEINEHEIKFNGIKGQDCELFTVRAEECPRNPGRAIFTYCKTENLPYDLCVKCALVILKHHLGDHIQVMSDGSDKDWQDAKHICFTHLGYGQDFVLSTDNRTGRQ